MTSRRELYAAGEPFGDSATRSKPFGRVYGGGGGGGGTSTTKMTIPDELKPAAQSLSKIATNVGNTPYTPYAGQGVADLNGYQTQGMNLVANRALSGDSTINAGANFLQNQINSGPVSATRNPSGGVAAGQNPYAQQVNPYLDQMVQKAQDSVKSNMNTAMANSGSFGNSGVQQATAQGLGDVATQMYGNAYNTQAQLAESGLGRDLQAQQFNSQMGNDWASRNDSMYQNSMAQKLNAAQLGLNYGNQAYQDAAQLMNAGQTAYNNAQDKLDFNYQQYQNRMDYPIKQLGALSGVISGNSGSTTTQTGGGK